MESYFATVGFFDGVHRGHRDLIKQLIKVSKKRKMKSAVVTFRQHPRRVLNQEYQPQLLTTCEEKEWLLKNTCDMDECFMLDFTVELASFSAKEFMQFLRDEYNVRGLLIGYDHKFGHNRSEGYEDYVRYGEELGIEVLQAVPFQTKEGLIISSSIIRQYVTEGKMAKAAYLLGCGLFVSGTVVLGHQIGRIEIHVIHYKKDLYGKYLMAMVINRVRDEKRFSSKEELATQLEEDKGKIEGILKESDK